MAKRLNRVEQGERNRALVLAAARRVFLERGYAGATLEAIAEEAGFSKGVVYSQFAGKPDLFLALLEARIAERAERNALVSAGWNARPDTKPLNYVAAVDQYVVSAMLAATGPVTVRHVRVDEANAVDFLSRGVYRRWKDPQQVDAVTTELVDAVFAKFTVGQFDLPTLITAMVKPVHDRRLLLWAADEDEQNQLARMRVSGSLPNESGPFAMAVINNGGGNKLDAYLKVHTDYQPGRCTAGTRVGQIAVTLTNTAPSRGLPAYVNVRSDLVQLGLTGRQTRNGSNRILLDIYGPVGSNAALTSLDGQPLVPLVGLDNNHTVWRVAVPIESGQRRTVNVVMSTPAVDGDVGTNPLVLTQPMVMPATVSTKPLAACDNSSETRG